MKLSVVIPAHNEETNLKNMITILTKNFDHLINEIVVVNDCSTDNTGNILNKLVLENKRIIAIHRKNNPGVGNAIREGLRAISKKSDYVLMLDCDFTQNLENIRNIIKHATTADGIIGSRYLKKGSLINYPFLKKIANRSFHILTRLILRIPHADLTNNFKLYKISIIKDILPFLESTGFSINAETGIYPILLGYKLKEIPVTWIGRTPEMGQSSFKVIQAGPGYIKMLMKAILFKYLNKKKQHSLQEKESEHFNRLIESTGETYYGNLRPIASIRFRRKANSILEIINKLKNPKILDLGCGTGILSKYLLCQNPKLRIEGIDISQKAIDIAKKSLKKYKNAHFATGDALNLPFKNRHFDLVIGNSILHHIPLIESLKEIKRVINSGGKIWFCEPNILNPQIFLEKNMPILKGLLQDSEDERAFSRWYIKKILEKNGFKNVVSKPYEFLHPLLPKMLFKTIVPFAIWLEKIPLIQEFAGTIRITGEFAKKSKLLL